MVRPKKERAGRKVHTISFRVTEGEFIRLSHRASVVHLTVHQLARSLVLSRVKRLVVKTERRTDPMLVKQLYHIGINLNQLAKNSHIFGRVSPQVESLCVRIEALMDEVLDEQKGGRS
ncbi:MobC family plasmid mobilization relaxosome protein [bacterium]|nr:MobC family plasmid mobilization relaxosome protein [bacterium]